MVKYAKALFIFGRRRSDLPRLPDVVLQIGAFYGERHWVRRSPPDKGEILLIRPARHGIDRRGNCRSEACFFELGAGPAFAFLQNVMKVGNSLLIDCLDGVDDTAAMLDVGRPVLSRCDA
ncbi:hypothetical protein X731_18690 [Mesorhizobium sp. L2C054A000]|nr:hypothetical protein X731_18690 [Mesorhizobium sp. L2C054A000]